MCLHLYLAVVVICFVFALKTGLGWKRRKETPVGFTGGPSKSKKLFKGKVSILFGHSGHFRIMEIILGMHKLHSDHLGS